MDRPQLHSVFVALLGSTHVYFQPPAGMGMEYPCIVYSVDGARSQFADNLPYVIGQRYLVTVLDRNADSLIPGKISKLESALFDRHFTANNLHHSVFTLYL